MVLLVSNGAKVEHWETWEKSEVPAEHQIQGMGSVEMTVRRLDKLASTLTDMFGYTEISRSDDEAIFQSIRRRSFWRNRREIFRRTEGKTRPWQYSPFSDSCKKRYRAQLLGRTSTRHEASIHLALWIASTLRAYISVNQTGFYLKSQPMDQASPSMEMISKHWVKN